jgi:hypothetical protein
MLTKDEADILKDIAPENYFYAKNQAVIRNVKELKTALEGMDEDTFKHLSPSF